MSHTEVYERASGMDRRMPHVVPFWKQAHVDIQEDEQP
jgi:hypothetical protein